MTERYATSQKAAKLLELYSYYTGRPCPQGHYAERYAHSRECMACNRTDYAEKPRSPRRAPITITQRPSLAWAAGWARELDDPMKGWSPELREREERRPAGCLD